MQVAGTGYTRWWIDEFGAARNRHRAYRSLRLLEAAGRTRRSAPDGCES
jgi:hypothetical protein